MKDDKLAKLNLLIFLLILPLLIQAQSENLKNMELGVRLGSWLNGGASVDAVLNLKANRIHADLGFFENAFIAEGFYDWSFPIEEGFSFYPGVGGAIGGFKGKFLMGIGAEIGFEYTFKFPLSIGLDWRPIIQFINVPGFGFTNAGLNIRYRF